MNYKIIYSANARQDLRDIYQYIAFELLVPETASRQAQAIMKNIRSLEIMPQRHSLYPYEPWCSQGIRFFPVNNYLVFYLPDDVQKIIHIIRIFYNGRNINEQLDKELNF